MRHALAVTVDAHCQLGVYAGRIPKRARAPADCRWCSRASHQCAPGRDAEFPTCESYFECGIHHTRRMRASANLFGEPRRRADQLSTAREHWGGRLPCDQNLRLSLISTSSMVINLAQQPTLLAQTPVTVSIPVRASDATPIASPVEKPRLVPGPS